MPHCKRRQKLHRTLAQLQIPFLPGADVVHQGLVVVLRDNAQMRDAGIGHIGQGEVDLAVAPAVGQRRHRPLVRQLSEGAVVDIGKNDTHR